MIVFDIVNMLMRGVWGSSPQKKLGLNGVKLCNSRHHKHWLPFQKRLRKGSEKKGWPLYIFWALKVIRIFQILTVFNTGEQSEPEKFDYKSNNVWQDVTKYDRIAKRQHNWKRSTENKHKCRAKHKILYDLERTKSRLGHMWRTHFTRSYQGLWCTLS